MRFEGKIFHQNVDTYIYFVILSICLVIGTYLRVVGINFGLPQAFHPDEPHIVLATQRFFAGDFNPHNFLYPSLLMYLIHAVQRIYYFISASNLNLSTLYIISRLVVAMLGVFSIYLTFILGKILHNRKVGFVAALIVCLTPLHVIHSHYATTDVPLTFFILLALLSLVKLSQTANLSSYVLAGICFGLVVSTKIPGAVIFGSIFIVHLYHAKLYSQLHVKDILKQELTSPTRQVINIAVALITAVMVYLAFQNFQTVISIILSHWQIGLWAKYQNEIIIGAARSSLKFAVMAFLAMYTILFLFKLWSINLKNLLILMLVSVAIFFITNPYAILDSAAFLNDFLSQIVISQTSWGGRFEGSEPGYIINFTYIVKDYNLILIFTFFVGLFFYFLKPTIGQTLVLVFAVIYYLYIGSWKLMFDRYMVPLIPIFAILCAHGFDVTINYLVQKIKIISKNKSFEMAVVVTFYIIAIGLPIWGLYKDAYDFDRYLLKKNTKTIAYEWIQKNVPETALILREQYAPQVELAGFKTKNIGYAFNDSVNAKYIQDNNVDYIVVTDKMWNRDNAKQNSYTHIQEYADLIYKIKVTKEHPGPDIKVYRVNKPPKSNLSPRSDNEQ